MFFKSTHLVHPCTPHHGGTTLENSGTPWGIQYTQLTSTGLYHLIVRYYCSNRILPFENNLTRKHPRYFSLSTTFYFMKKLEFLQFVVCTTWMLSSMQSTNKPILKMTWSPLLGKNKISMTTFHEFICLRREVILVV